MQVLEEKAKAPAGISEDAAIGLELVHSGCQRKRSIQAPRLFFLESLQAGGDKRLVTFACASCGMTLMVKAHA